MVGWESMSIGDCEAGGCRSMDPGVSRRTLQSFSPGSESQATEAAGRHGSEESCMILAEGVLLIQGLSEFCCSRKTEFEHV